MVMELSWQIRRQAAKGRARFARGAARQPPREGARLRAGLAQQDSIGPFWRDLRERKEPASFCWHDQLGLPPFTRAQYLLGESFRMDAAQFNAPAWLARCFTIKLTAAGLRPAPSLLPRRIRRKIGPCLIWLTASQRDKVSAASPTIGF